MFIIPTIVVVTYVLFRDTRLDGSKCCPVIARPFKETVK